MRLFVAVHLPDEVRERLAVVQHRLQGVQADVSWVRPGNIHLTLKFLGEVEPVRLDGLRVALAEVARATEPCEVAVAGVGSFGGRIPRVVWAGIMAGAETLSALAGRVDAALVGVGFPRESRPFSPHLTLGRVRSSRNAAEFVGALRDEAREDFGATRVTAYFLMESQLNPKGSIYTVVDSFPLGAR